MTLPERLPHFEHPPLERVSLGAVFDPLPRLQTVHLGLFWAELGQEDFPTVQEMNARPAVIEEFPARREAPDFDLSFLDRPQLPRVVWTHVSGDIQVALQNDAFQVAWRRGSTPYPRYEHPREIFERTFQLWRSFAESNGLGSVRTRQAEVSYANSLPAGSGWTELAGVADLVRVATPVPGRSGLLEEFHYSDTYRVAGDEHRGRMKLSLFSGDGSADDQAATLTLTIKGPTRDANLLEYLDFGHEAIVAAFVEVTTDRAHELWGRRQES